MSRSPRGSTAVERVESSADETTPIIRKKRATVNPAGTVIGRSEDPGPPTQDPSPEGSIVSRRNGKRPADGAAAPAPAAAPDTSSGKEEKPGWWRTMLDRYGAVELDNKGSVARDHLALERTFLAWLRTSLAFASIGIAITQLFRLNTTLAERDDMPDRPDAAAGDVRLKQLGKPLGATFLGVSILILFIGWRRYFESQYWLSLGKFPASRGSILLVTFVAGALIVTSLVIVVSIRRWDQY